MNDVEVKVESGDEVYVPANRQEEIAMTRGWKPEHLFEGNKDEWVDANTFNIKGEFMDVISQKTKKIKEMERAFDKMSKYIAQQDELAFERAKEALLEQKAEALNSGDTYAAVKKDEEIRTLEKDFEDNRDKVNPVVQVWQNAQADWEKNNDWYNSNKGMKTKSHSLGKEFVEANPGCDPEEMYQYIDEEMRKAYPSYFKNTKREEPGDIAPSSKSGNRGGGRSYKLSPVELKIAERMVARGAFKSVAEYAEKLREID